ncbi:flagellar biosynthetic protein FlhB [Pelagirhabdus alkalitolerans]|uniref:Flagellar biosynthetic protein FlhB n=1 Tax=Pelagirhabdus alkalitolerans TaxID=1612202 RepID=A0A1G6H3D9_9BACI|nr:flagellar biosynthesis protein FlhB [Pelagirhabdus alkalitolerans]SDB88817.1 flagellar biosynthetic protein FlhB [Pelagirhabdus alkalitolerans]
MELLHLDLQFFSGEKTEKATPKKRQDTRQKGQVAKSQEINTAILLFFMFIAFMVIGSFWHERFTGLYEHVFTEYVLWDLTPDTLHTIFVEVIGYMALTIAPAMGVAIVAGLASNLMQVGFLFTTEPLQFKLDKINPISGAKRVFSARAIVELLKSILKITVIGTVTFSIIWMNRGDMLMLANGNIDGALSFFSSTAISMGIYASLALLFLAALDYTYQRYDHEKNIRMSKNDIKDEHKNIEGDPLIKSKIKERQRQMATKRMMDEIPDADVVITNPTHYAVAIKYDEDKSDAPYVVAKGVDYVAFKIRDVAKNNQVMIVENRPLARALYSDVEIDQVIPESFFQAVAEVLAYVYQVEKKA